MDCLEDIRKWSKKGHNPISDICPAFNLRGTHWSLKHFFFTFCHKGRAEDISKENLKP